MQTILGAGGPIANELAQILPEYTDQIRLVSRHPQKINESDELHPADLLVAKQAEKAIQGSEVVYLTVGLPYDHNVWERDWPVLMSNTINACKKAKAKLVFFDNMYMYHKEYLDGMNEETPVKPTSRKGKVRAKIAQMLTDEMASGILNVVISRCADFYGPGIDRNSILNELVTKNLAAGKKANWLVNDAVKHSFTFVPDAAKATAVLGNTEDAYNQVWHLPTASEPPTGKEWVEMIAAALQKEPRYRVTPGWMLKGLGLFVPVLKETVEMLYQYDRDYVFNSTKFEEKFNFKPTPYAEGVRKMIKADYGK